MSKDNFNHILVLDVMEIIVRPKKLNTLLKNKIQWPKYKNDFPVISD